MKKIYKITINAIFIITIILLSLYAILRFTNKVEIYEVETGSMEDGIHAGDYIMIYKSNNYKVGDIVTYKKNNVFVTHRIVTKVGEKVVTKGDANNIEDEEITTKNIVGKVVLKGGILNIVIKFKYAIISLLLALYLLSYYFDSSNKEKDEKDNNENKENEALEEVEKKEKEKNKKNEMKNKE